MSSGLVLFHFQSKDQLLLDLLDWVLATTTALKVGPAFRAIESPHARFIALLKQEMTRLAAEPSVIRVFFEFWTAGLHLPDFRSRMKPELDRYRSAFQPIAAEVIATEPERFSDVSPDALAAVAVSMIKGCAIQSLIEPSLDLDQYLAAADRLLRGPSIENDDRASGSASSGAGSREKQRSHPAEPEAPSHQPQRAVDSQHVSSIAETEQHHRKRIRQHPGRSSV